MDFFAEDVAPLRLLRSGPMITAAGGYPLNSWGWNGYGLPCDGADAARACVARVAESGAGVVKLPVAGQPGLDDEAMAAAVDAAHGLGLPVLSHAMGAEEVARALDAGVDGLAHTPTGADLDPRGWGGRVLISTLAAFGGGETAVANLAALRAAGVTVLYGTDFGNGGTTGVSPDEIALLEAAGLDGAAILAAGTSAPAAWWGFSELGEIAPGKAASVMVLDADPLVDPSTLARPVQVWIDGKLQG